MKIMKTRKLLVACWGCIFFCFCLSLHYISLYVRNFNMYDLATLVSSGGCTPLILILLVETGLNE